MSESRDDRVGLGKAEARARARADRAAYSPEFRARASHAWFERIVREPALSSARVVCAYAPMRTELDISPLFEHLWSMGKTLALPRIEGATGELHLHHHLEEVALMRSRWGVSEPPPTAPLASDDEVDVILVPALAFDANGYRLGYGQGFYDRLLPRLTRAMRVGVGFDEQLWPCALPHDPWDQRLQRFVSDHRTLEFDTSDTLLP